MTSISVLSAFLHNIMVDVQLYASRGIKDDVKLCALYAKYHYSWRQHIWLTVLSKIYDVRMSALYRIWRQHVFFLYAIKNCALYIKIHHGCMTWRSLLPTLSRFSNLLLSTLITSTIIIVDVKTSTSCIGKYDVEISMYSLRHISLRLTSKYWFPVLSSDGKIDGLCVKYPYGWNPHLYFLC